MNLDKRIKALTDIQSVTDGCHDWQFMTKKGYFAESITDFENLKKCVYAEYIGYREHERCFHYWDEKDGKDYTHYARYFIPEDSLLPVEKPVEKKYRAFTLNEFLERYKIGDTVTFRLKKDEHIPEAECLVEYKRMITGYEILPEDKDIPGKGSILLGGCPPTGLARLFEFYELENEYYFPAVWKPFGIEVKENEEE